MTKCGVHPLCLTVSSYELFERASHVYHLLVSSYKTPIRKKTHRAPPRRWRCPSGVVVQDCEDADALRWDY